MISDRLKNITTQRNTAPFYVLWRDSVPNSPMVKEGDFFREQGGLEEDWGKYWIPVQASSIGHARWSVANAMGVELSPIYAGEE